VYPPDFDDWVEVHGAMTSRLEGAQRPGHFRGVTTIVALLFEITRPNRAYFGQKDAQQLRVIRRMVIEREMPVQIVGMPIVRDDDGLAMSSRNVYLRPMDRRAALTIGKALKRGEAMVAGGERDAGAIRGAVVMTLNSEPRVVVDYVSVSSEETFEELEVLDRPALLLIAARVGDTRLIDNALLIPEGMDVPEHLRELVAPAAK
jgi:pantoate--beta-alanine ligase